ncbi:MAG: nucleotidyltransferase substrate binding protein [Novosphingobium sp.]
MQLDFSSFVKAVSLLDEGLERYNRDPSDIQIRDGLIQRFEFAYDLAHKMLRRQLESVSANPDQVDRLSFADLIRTVTEQGLIGSDWTTWRIWREMRSTTTHTYDEDKALQVVAGIPGFLAEAHDLAERSKQVRYV